MSIGERLCASRKRLGYTQEYVAEHIGIAKSTYCGYEIGNREPSLDKLKRLCELYHVSSDYLLGISRDMGYEEQDVQEMETDEVRTAKADENPWKVMFEIDENSVKVIQGFLAEIEQIVDRIAEKVNRLKDSLADIAQTADASDT